MGALNNYFKPQFLGYGQSEVALDRVIAERDAAEGREHDNRFGTDALTKGTFYQQARFSFSPVPPTGGLAALPAEAPVRPVPEDTRTKKEQWTSDKLNTSAPESHLAASGEYKHSKPMKIADFSYEGETDGKNVFRHRETGIVIEREQGKSVRWGQDVRHRVIHPDGSEQVMITSRRKIIFFAKGGMVFASMDGKREVTPDEFAPPKPAALVTRAKELGGSLEYYKPPESEGFWRLSVERNSGPLYEDYDRVGNSLDGEEYSDPSWEPSVREAEKQKRLRAAHDRHIATIESPDRSLRFNQEHFDDDNAVLRKKISPEAAAVLESVQAVAGVNGAKVDDIVFIPHEVQTALQGHLKTEMPMRSEQFLGILVQMDPETRLLAINRYIDDTRLADRLTLEFGYRYPLDQLRKFADLAGVESSHVAKAAPRENARELFAPFMATKVDKTKTSLVTDEERWKELGMQVDKVFKDLAIAEGLGSVGAHLLERQRDAVRGTAALAGTLPGLGLSYIAKMQSTETALNEIEHYRQSGEKSAIVFAQERGFDIGKLGLKNTPEDWDIITEEIERNRVAAFEWHVRAKREEERRQNTFGNPESESELISLFEGGIDAAANVIIFTMLKEYKGVEFAAKVIGMLDIAGIAKDAVLELTYEEIDPYEVSVNALMRLFRQKVVGVVADKFSAGLGIKNDLTKKTLEEIVSKYSDKIKIEDKQ